MADKFIPLSLPNGPTAAKDASAFCLTVRSSSSEGSEAARLSPSPNGPPIADSPLAAHPSLPPHAAPKLSLIKSGDRITLIRVECVCGQVIELACDY